MGEKHCCRLWGWRGDGFGRRQGWGRIISRRPGGERSADGIGARALGRDRGGGGRGLLPNTEVVVEIVDRCLSDCYHPRISMWERDFHLAAYSISFLRV